MAFYLYSINTGFYINSGGYVGVLNSNPQYPLDISGTCKATNFIGDSISGRIISGDTFTTQNFVVNTFSALNFTGKNFSGTNFTGENVYAEHLIGTYKDNGNGFQMPYGVYQNGDLVTEPPGTMIQGTDLAGIITIGSVSSNDDIAPLVLRVVFRRPYSSIPFVLISPRSLAATYPFCSGITCYSDDASYFRLNTSYVLKGGQAYQWNYVVIGAQAT